MTTEIDILKEFARELRAPGNCPLDKYKAILHVSVPLVCQQSNAFYNALLLRAFRSSRVDIVDYLLECGARITSQWIFSMVQTDACSVRLLDHILEADAQYFQHIKKCLDEYITCPDKSIVIDIIFNWSGSQKIDEKVRELKIRMDIHATIREATTEQKLAQKTSDLAKLEIAHSDLQVQYNTLKNTLTQALEILNGNNKD